MGVLREITRLPDAIHRLSRSLQGLSDAQSDGLAMDRLDELERSRALWEAEMQAWFLKAESKYKAAAAAEGRARKLSDKLDLFDADSEGDETPARDSVQPNDAQAREEEELFAMRVGLETNTKAHAVRAKWGG